MIPVKRKFTFQSEVQKRRAAKVAEDTASASQASVRDAIGRIPRIAKLVALASRM